MMKELLGLAIMSKMTRDLNSIIKSLTASAMMIDKEDRQNYLSEQLPSICNTITKEVTDNVRMAEDLTEKAARGEIPEEEIKPRMMKYFEAQHEDNHISHDEVLQEMLKK